MKRLIPMIAVAACAIGAFAADTFEDVATGKFAGGAGTLWDVPEGAEANVVEGNAAKGNKYLDITDSPAATPIKRVFKRTEANDGEMPETIPATGLYFDSMVKFTVSDTLDQTGVEGAKIAVFAYCNEEAASKVTNLVAKAGFYDETGTLKTKDYILDSGDVKLDADTWYRLTIKAIKITDAGKYGFVAYLNGKALTYADETGLTDLTATAQKYATAKSLLPSMINSGDTIGTLTSVSFVGSGKLDDVDFTATVPDFAKDAFVITIVKTEGVESVTVNGNVLSFNSENKATVELDPSATTISIAATKANGYEWDGWTDNTAYSVSEGMPAIEVKAYAVVFTVDGTSYKTLDEAVNAAVASGKTLKLMQNLTNVLSFEGNLVIDLAGHDIVVDEYADAAIVIDGGSLTVYNSTPTIGKVYAGSTGAAVFTEVEGVTVTVYGGQFEGAVYGAVTCSGGKFAGDAIEFPYTLAAGYTATFANGYWTVAKEATGDLTWDEVTEETTVEEVVAPETAAELRAAASTVTATEIKTWATANGVEIKAVIPVNALIFNVAPTAAPVGVEAEQTAANEVLKKLATKKGDQFTALLQSNGGAEVTVTDLSAEYPMSAIKLVPYAGVTTSAKLFKLTIGLK